MYVHISPLSNEADLAVADAAFNLLHGMLHVSCMTEQTIHLSLQKHTIK